MNTLSTLLAPPPVWSVESDLAIDHTRFTIDDTPRHGIDGTTEVTMDSANRLTRLTWRPLGLVTIDDITRDRFIRDCECELGEAHYEESGDEQIWRWTSGGCVREVIATPADAIRTFSLSYCERALAMASALQNDLD
jgi:hypothetical protein